MNEQKNTVLALALSGMVMLAWLYFFGPSQTQRQLAQQPQAQTQPAATPGATTPGSPANVPVTVPGQQASPAHALTRDDALKLSATRIAIDTPDLKGTIALTGGRVDDVLLTRYHETVDRSSPPIELLSPSRSPNPFYAEFGWIAADAAKPLDLPNATTVWTQEGAGALTPDHPVVLTYTNPQGLAFRRTIKVDTQYMFSVTDEVANHGTESVALFPYALISRHGTPEGVGSSGVHEGMIGDLGDKGLKEVAYKKMESEKTNLFENVTGAWLGITDKYWAAVLVPDPKQTLLKARFSSGEDEAVKTFQADYVLPQVVVAPGATGTATGRLFAGAKEVHILNAYNSDLGLHLFDRLINWGWFWFFAKPLFEFIDLIFRWVGNFGVAILIVTVAIKTLFFPLANRSYASMAKMKSAQPQLQALRERYPDDKAKQQQEMMEIYKREKINPVAGCLPILIQIPVFYALYTVLVTTIEMRHAPFFGWIHDLSSPDPTNIFTLFGMIHWDPTVVPVVGSFLHLGIWPLIMGVTMWLQMKLNPAPPDPAQKMMFDWMPVIFTFMLANFSAGLVIYWAWNNSLSVTQQSIIMKKHGAKIELWNNVRALWPSGLGATFKRLPETLAGLWEKLKARLPNNRAKL